MIRHQVMTFLEPLAEVKGALLVVEVLHLPHPQLGGLGLGNSLEHLQMSHSSQRLGYKLSENSTMEMCTHSIARLSIEIMPTLN